MWFWKKRTSRPPRLALMTCVRNEASWLPAFLHYHHAIGVERGYVFLDRCTDDSAAIAASFPWVRLFQLVPDRLDQFQYVCDLQAACMNHVLQLARADGIDWLMMIDPDEYAYAGNPRAQTAVARAHLHGLVQRVRADVVQIRLTTHEVVPQRLPADAPFWQHHYFQTEPKLAWTIVDPLRQRQGAWHDFLGHRQGKALVRTSAHVQAYDAHRWVPEQGLRWPQRPEYVELPGVWLGAHLHYFVTSQRHWLAKFPKYSSEPEVWVCGKPVELPKQCWKEVVSRMSAAELEGYFQQHVARPEAELRDQVRNGLVLENTVVLDVLRESRALREGRVLDCPSPRPPSGIEWFDPLPATTTQRAAGLQLSYPMTHLHLGSSRGFHTLERSGADYFRWTEPQAALQLHVPPGDYWLRLEMKRLAKLWPGKIALRLNERTVPLRDRQLRSGVLSLRVDRADFPDADQFWLQLAFDTVDTARWSTPDQRQLGAPLFSVCLEPRAA